MKKILCLTLAVLALSCIFSACSDAGAGDDGRLKVVCTVMPPYDWTMQLLGDLADEADVTLLLDRGVDLHSYQPTVDDIVKITTCDLFIYVGGESDAWVDSALKDVPTDGKTVINLMQELGDAVKEEEHVEGMETEDEHGGDESGEEPEYDEHIWLSLRNAKRLCPVIAAGLGVADPDNAAVYNSNCNEYLLQLDALDTEYTDAVAQAKYKTLLFGDRFPFRYLTDDYGLDYYAAFAGCSAETEASFETVVFLAGKADELGIGAVLTIDGSDNKIAETIIRNTPDGGLSVLSLNSMQSVTAEDIAGGVSYLSVMRENLEVLKLALN